MHSLLNKTLILRFSSIGDIVLASPLIRALRRRFPEARIDFVVKTEFAELVRYNPYLSSVIEYSASQGFAGLVSLKRQIRSTAYDTVIDIHNNFRSIYLRSWIGAGTVAVMDKRLWKRFMLVRFKWNRYDGLFSVADRYIEPLRSLGIENDGVGTEVFVPKAVTDHVSELWRSYRIASGRQVIALAHSAKHITKMWPADRYAELGCRIIENGGVIILLGSQADTIRSNGIADLLHAKGVPKSSVVNLTGELDLLRVAALMDICSLVVANDSGLMHLAGARKRPVVGIFGPTVKEFGFFPVGTRNRVVERTGLECRPCSHLGGPRCPKGHFRCMADISVEQVYQTVQTLLSS